MGSQKFVNIDTLVSEVLLGIGDEQNKRYQVKAMQWVINTIRRVHVNISPYYKEVRLEFDNEDIFSIDYPTDAIKILSVGIYLEDEFWSFTKKNNMSILTSGADYSEFDTDSNEGLTVPGKGYKFGSGSSNIAYWVDDTQHCRVLVRMFSYYNSSTSYQDRTEWLKDKGVIVRYKSTGVDCNGDVCVPIEARDLIVQKVIYEFMRKGWGGIQNHNYNVELQRAELNALQEEYETLLYEPHHFEEIKDAVYGSLNATARR